MPRIRPYEQQIASQGSIPGRTATAADFGGEVGQAIQELGVTGQQAAASAFVADKRREAERERLADKQMRDELLAAQVTVAKGRSQWQQWLVDSQATAAPDGKGYVENFNKEFDKYKEQTLLSVTLPEAKTRLEADLEGMRATLIDNALVFEGTARAKAQVSGVKQAFAANENFVLSSPTKRAEILVQETQLIDGLKLPPNTKTELALERKFKINNAAVEGSISALLSTNNAGALKEYLNHLQTEGTWKTDLAPPDYERAVKTLRQAVSTLERADRATYLKYLEERIKERAAGTDNMLSPNEAAGDPAITRQINSAIEIGNARNAVRAVPYAEMVGMINKAQERIAQPGDFNADASYAEAVMSAARERMQAFTADPAAYTIQNNKVVSDAFKAVQESNFSAEAVTRYRNVAAEAQRELGAPWHTPKLLPKSTTELLAAEVASLPAESVADRMEQLRQQYGPMWTEVMGELQGKVRPEYLTLGRLTAPSDAVVRRDLAEAIKSDEIIRKNLPEGEAKNIDSKVENAMLPYARTLSGSGAVGQAVLRGEIRSAQQLAYYYFMQGESANDAAKKATNALIFDRYDMGDTFLAPKGELDRARREASRVMRETPLTQFNVPPGGDPNLSEDYRRNAERADAQRGYWANVTDLETGKFGIEWRKSDGSPVLLKDGKRVRLFFDDIRALPAPQPRIRNAPRGFSTTPGGAAVYGTE